MRASIEMNKAVAWLVAAYVLALAPVWGAEAGKSGTIAGTGRGAVAETIDIPLAVGEVKLLTLRTLPLNVATDVSRNTIRMAVEWLPNDKE